MEGQRKGFKLRTGTKAQLGQKCLSPPSDKGGAGAWCGLLRGWCAALCALLGGREAGCGDPGGQSGSVLAVDSKRSGRSVYLSDTSMSRPVWPGLCLVTVSSEAVSSWNSFWCARFKDAAGEFRDQKSMCRDCICRSFPALQTVSPAQNCCRWGKVGARSSSCNTQVYGGSLFCSLGKGGMVPSWLGRCLWSHRLVQVGLEGQPM